ncbi:hypothetical protein LR48_Vigan01g162600 [Vigna angularis]|uniref:Protein kinase domain-containing protein n=1 Tax=Phaseolus angularis TaxID=3914 RepID=A0A0L9TNE1_PHAAN|nr:hypothetical protein LR48_Vigan01g162600 [Vigna angularis]
MDMISLGIRVLYCSHCQLWQLGERCNPTRGQPPDYVLRDAKNSSKFFKCVGSLQNIESSESSKNGRSLYQVLTVEEYEARELKKPAIGKEYFNHMNLEAIVTNYPYRKNLAKEDIVKESQIRLALIDFLKGLVELDPSKRWSPVQASKHPFVTGEPFTHPYKPPPETPQMRKWRKQVELPTFEGIDPEGWISRAEKVFDIQNVAAREKLRLAYTSIGAGAIYWLGVWKNKIKNPSWKELTKALIRRFGERDRVAKAAVSRGDSGGGCDVYVTTVKKGEDRGKKAEYGGNRVTIMVGNKVKDAAVLSGEKIWLSQTYKTPEDQWLRYFFAGLQFNIQRKQLAQHDDDEEIGWSYQQVLSFLASRMNKSGQREGLASVAAIKIQKRFWGWKKRKEFLIIHQKIVKIQAHVSGHQVRRQYRTIIWSMGILEKKKLLKEATTLSYRPPPKPPDLNWRAAASEFPSYDEDEPGEQALLYQP